jgi:alpha-L-fucosidase
MKMKKLWFFLALTLPLSAQTYKPTWDSIDSRPTPVWFEDAKFGIFIHWGVYSVPAYAPVIPGVLAYSEWYWSSVASVRDNPDPKDNPVGTGTWVWEQKVYGADHEYQSFASQFHAELFDPVQWADTFVASGAKYVVLTSKHHEGFALWPSKEASTTWGRSWNAAEIGPKRDLVGDLTDAVRARGLKMGYYYSLYEWFNPVWLSDRKTYVDRHMIPQLKDLVTRYKPSVLFTDGEWDATSAEWRAPEILAWLFNESPVKDEIVINDRWGSETRHKHGGYWTTEYTVGMSGIDHPWEESRGIGSSYGYNRAERLQDYRTGAELVYMLTDIVSRGGNFLLDIGPTADGTIPVIMQQRLHEVGDWLRINGDAIYATRPAKVSHQWSAGERPKINYNAVSDTPYDVSKLVAPPESGHAAIEAFFTEKGSDLYAILPRWPGASFIVKDITGVKSVSLLGAPGELKFEPSAGGVRIDLPLLPENLFRQPAWVLKLSR